MLWIIATNTTDTTITTDNTTDTTITTTNTSNTTIITDNTSDTTITVRANFEGEAAAKQTNRFPTFW